MKFKLIILIALIAIGFGFNNSNKAYKPATEIVWLTNLEEAQKIANKTKKPILANFTGSDWCGWCVKLSKEVFNTPEFKKWAEKNVVLLELDFPKNKPQTPELKQQNAGLQQAFQVQGFPTIWVFNLTNDKATKKQNIEAIVKTGYMAGGPKVFTDAIQEKIIEFNKNKKE